MISYLGNSLDDLEKFLAIDRLGVLLWCLHAISILVNADLGEAVLGTASLEILGNFPDSGSDGSSSGSTRR